MKKVFAAVAAMAIMAVSAIPAFASVDSPVATTQPETQATTSPVKPPENPQESPKTGSSDVAAYSVIALSLAACGAASVALVKSKK